ncbi:hypothetical protein R1sor_023112 [Riccia sorocarpa]|uniref:Cation efflux protein transmembrane domain-containing protein n=1 Tax=Riccia sorocarpa TaxID=122646 RepID=A0ABD3GQP8_9MARC
MLLRKASAFRISWSYHLYSRASLPKSAGLSSPRQKFHHLLGEKYSPKFSTSSAAVNNSGTTFLISRTICGQNASTLFSIRGPALSAGASDLSLGSSDGYLLPCSLLRHCSCKAASHDDAQGRTFHGHATARITQDNKRPQDSDCENERGVGTKVEEEDPWTDLKMRKLSNCVVGLKTSRNFESSEESTQTEIGGRDVHFTSKLLSQSLGFPSTIIPSISGSSPRSARFRTAPSVLAFRTYSSGTFPSPKIEAPAEPLAREYSQRAVVTALWCNFLVFSLKLGVWVMTSSHVMLAEAIHSLADLANQGLLAYGLMSSKRAPDAMHPYGYSKERFVWSLISAVGIFCLGSGATIIHGVQNLFSAQPLENVYLAALVLGGSAVMEGASLLVAISCVRNGAKAEGMTMRDYLWRGHDPTSVAVMMEDGAAVTGLGIAAVALAAAHYTGNPMWDPVGSIVVGNLLGVVAIFLIQRNRQALLGRSMDDKDMMRVMTLLSKDPVVDAIYDCKSEVIGPGAYRFKAEIDFNGIAIVQNYLTRAGRENWRKEFTEAVGSTAEPGQLDRVLAAYGEEVVSALGSEVDRLEKEIQKTVPGIRHVDIEAHNPNGPAPRERFYMF